MGRESTKEQRSRTRNVDISVLFFCKPLGALGA
jgi:hypothetical protein